MNRRLVAWSIVASPVAALALLLLGCATTVDGRLAAACTLLLVATPALALAKHPRAWRTCAATLLAAGALLIARSPTGAPRPGAPTRAVYLDGGTATRLALTNLVPEADQLVLATYLVWLPDPVMNFAGARRLRDAIRATYAPVERDPEMRALGTAMGDALTDRDTGRVFVYEPPHAPGERRPAILFLHGSAGSWKGYFQAIRSLAQRRRWGLAQPSFGFGNWSRRSGVGSIERTRAWLAAQPWVDPTHVYLAGLSNGGRGMTRTLRNGPARYRGLLFVSAVIEPRVLDEGPLDPSWRGVPALVLHGERDDRIPLDYADEGVAALRDQGLDVRYVTLAREDHYLIFTDTPRVLREADAWLDAVETAPSH